MPRVGMKPIRREALVKATIAEVGRKGSLDVTVAHIAARAGVSSGLAHHYFGGKEDLLFAAMRHILSVYASGVRDALAVARTPRDRLDGIIRASFGPANFAPDVIAAWLSFYVHAQSDPGARRLLRIYQGRLASHLTFALRPLVGDRAPDTAETLAATIDGLYIRHALGGAADGAAASARVTRLADRLVAET